MAFRALQKTRTLLLTAMSLWLAASTFAAEYSYFITADGSTYWTNGVIGINPEKIEEAKHAPDARPAELDPEGNWGLFGYDCQVSLRFEKPEFSTNEPITATLIVRNVGTNECTFCFKPFFTFNIANSISIINPQGTVLERSDLPLMKSGRLSRIVNSTGHDWYWLGPGTQNKFKLDLKSHFDLPPGRYVVYGQVQLQDSETKIFSNEIQSGNAVITIR